MLDLSNNNTGEFANFISNTSNPVDEVSQSEEAHLTSALNFALAESWVNGKTTLHVHARVRSVGESITDDLCFLFKRKNPCTDTILKKDRIRTPCDSFPNSFIPHERNLKIQGSVLIHIGKMTNSGSRAGYSRDAEIWLRLLNDCPRVPIDFYPIKNTTLWIALSGLDFIKEQILIFENRKLIPPSWFMSFSKDKLPNEVVKGASKIVGEVASYYRKSNTRLRERLNHYSVPGAITPYITETKVGIEFAPVIPLRYESIMMFFGPADLGSDSSKVSNPRTHMIYYNSDGEENAKNPKGARYTRAHKERVPG